MANISKSVVTYWPFEPVCLIVIIVLVGAVALAKEAKIKENGASNLKTKKQRANIKEKVTIHSITEIAIAFPRLFLIELNYLKLH